MVILEGQRGIIWGMGDRMPDNLVVIGVANFIGRDICERISSDLLLVSSDPDWTDKVNDGQISPSMTRNLFRVQSGKQYQDLQRG